MATLPPWLDITPQTYLGAATAGLREGVQVGEEKMRDQEFQQNLAFQRDKQAQDLAINAQDMQMRQLNQKMALAKFLQDTKQQNLENQLRLDKFQSDKNIQEQSLAVDKQYKEQMMQFHMTQAKTQQDRFQMQSDIAARKFQAQQMAMQRIHNGEDPAKVLLDLGGALGESASGLASLYKQTQPPPEIPNNGPQVIERDGQKFLLNYDRFGTPRYSELRSQGAGADSKQVEHLLNAIKVLQANTLSAAQGTPENAKLRQYQAALDAILLKQGGGGGGAGIRSVTPFTQTNAHDEAGDQGGGIGISPPHDEEGETTAAPDAAQAPLPSGAMNYQSYLALPH